MRKLFSKAYPWAAPLLMGTAYLLYLYFSDHFVYTRETCQIIRRAQELAYDGIFPLAGNHVNGRLRLGPLAELLTTIPIWITGRVDAVYVFLALLYLASIPVFYLAVRGWLNSEFRVFAATTWFSFFPIYIAHLVSPWNTSYLNFFLAIYTWIVLRYPTGSRLLLLYAAIGLCMQCNLICIALIPASLIFLQTVRTHIRRNLLWHLGGIATIVLLHLPLVWYYLKEPEPIAFLFPELEHGVLGLDWLILIIGLTVFPLATMYPIIVLSGFALKGLRAGTMSLPRGKGRILSVIVFLVIVVAWMEAKCSAIKSSVINFHYYYPLLPFVSLYLGLVASRFALYAKPAIKVASVITIVVVSGFVVWVSLLASDMDHHISDKLHYQKCLAEDTFSWMRRHDWQGSTTVHHLRFGQSPHGEPPYRFSYESSNCIDTMIRFGHRKEFRFRPDGDQLTVISIVKPVVPFGDPRAWLGTAPGTIPENCEAFSKCGDIENLICP